MNMLDHRVVIIGESGVGKTQLFNAIFGYKFTQTSNPTIAYSFKTLKNKNLEFFDMGGDAKWQFLATEQLRQANYILYCVDFSRENINDESIKDQLTELGNNYPTSSIILVATKCDPEIRTQALKQLEHLNIDSTIQRIAISAKDGFGLNQKAETDNLIDCLSTEKKIKENNYKALLKEATTKLKKALCKDVTETQKEEIIQKISNLYENLKSKPKMVNDLVDNFVEDCAIILEGKHPHLMNLVKSVAVAALIGMLVVGVGIVCPIPTVALITAPTTIGLASGGLNYYSLFNQTKKIKPDLEETTNILRNLSPSN